ncbi:tripartite motif-containing protein 3-like [Pecten maximus]|uniref:tripartite motif-containing protein 3-like n=1 Tax=Pecten maximus TaxID=6579 RepID=UPI001458D3B3|nr:tripartite motif-containing protein 3-like [Pecten maximus]
MAAAVQTAVRKKGQGTCIHHVGKAVEFICEKCNELACKKCVGSRHRGHELTELSEIAEQKKSEMITFIKEIENIKLPHINENKDSIDKEIAETSDYFDKMETTVQERGVKLKNEIDESIKRSTSLCQKMKAENVQRLTDYKKCLKDSQEGLAKQLHECKTRLQEASVIELCDVGHAFRSLALNLPATPGLHTAIFEAPSQYRCYLEQALGMLTTNDLSESQSRSTTELPSPMVESASGSSTSGAMPTNRLPVKFTLLPQTSIMGKFHTERIGNRISPTGSEEVWISYSDILQLLNKKGKVRTEIQFNVRITDISISPITKNVWVCSDADSTVMECIQGTPNLRFHCKNKPICLCVTTGNEILVGMSQKVTRFTEQGKVLLSTKTPTSGQALVRLPQKITECRLTKNVAVVERQSYDENSKKQVIVMDKKFEEMFRYKSDTKAVQQAVNAAFDPWDVTFDSVGNLLIADCNNHSVLLINPNGEFMKTLFTDERSTQAICLDKNLVLWAVFGDVVKRLQYYSVGHD